MGRDALAQERRLKVAGWMADGEIATCLPFVLEAGYSARSPLDHEAMASGFPRLQRVEITPQIERRAVDAQHELALVGHHRLPPSDILIAVCAHDCGVGVLHYDSDYDVILQHTSLAFESVWLAPRGTL
jgi:predicted nucleic acid-binding protein